MGISAICCVLGLDSIDVYRLKLSLFSYCLELNVLFGLFRLCIHSNDVSSGKDYGKKLQIFRGGSILD